MKVCVTGASGFIGKNFLLKASKEWEIYAFYYPEDAGFLEFLKSNCLENVHPVYADLTDEANLKSSKEKIPGFLDAVLYLAANSDPAVSVQSPAFDLKCNVLALANFFSVFSCDKAIYFSSGAVYDGLAGLAGPESKLDPKLPYAISKLAGEQLIKFFHKSGKVKNYQIIRFFGAFGPYEPKRKIYTKLINTFCFENKNEFTVRGDGNSLIDAMYIDDAINGIIKIISMPKESQVIDFGIGTPITINELVKRTAKALGKETIAIKHEGDVPEYIEFHISPKRFEEQFSFQRQFTLEEGIKKFKEFLEKDNPS